MLQVNNLTKHFGKQTLFKKISFSLSKGEKVGLVGRNGSGKSTIIRMILGQIEPDEGDISYPKGYRLGSLPQHIHFTKTTVLEEGCLALKNDEKYDAYKVETILSGLGFSATDQTCDPKTFSGGFQIRINLAKALVQNPDILLLDEPTNYLDIVSQRWLKQYLNAYSGEIILITHDRQFMDQVTTHTMGLYRQKLKKLKGGTSKYYSQIQEEDEIHDKTRKNLDIKKKHLQKYIDRFRVSARRASQAQSRIKQLAKLDDMDALARERNLSFFFNYAPCPSKTVMSINDLCFSYDPQNRLIDHLTFSIGKHDRIGIIGKNGKGKSTLLNLLAGELKPQDGSIVEHPNRKTGHFGQTNIQRLHPQNRVVDEIASVNPALTMERVRTICGIMMFDQDLALKKVHTLSGGERSRVLLGKILANSANLLLLDEPNNHLDQESVEGLIQGLTQFKGAVAIVTHSEMILNHLVNKLVVFHRGRVEFINGNYEYFLNKFGWDDEEQFEPSVTKIKTQHVATEQPAEKTAKPLAINKKEIRKKRSQIITERSKTLKPLKAEIDKLEKEICDLEEEVKRANQALIDASHKKNIQTFVTLSKEIKQNHSIIDKHFKRLEKISIQYDKEKRKFETQLLEIDI